MDTIYVAIRDSQNNTLGIVLSLISCMTGIITVGVMIYGFQRFGNQKIKEHQFVTMNSILNTYKSVTISIKKVKDSSIEKENQSENYLERFALYGYYNIPDNYKNYKLYICTEYFEHIQMLREAINDCYFPQMIYKEIKKLLDIDGMNTINDSEKLTGILIAKPGNMYANRSYYYVANNKSYANAYSFFETLNLITEEINKWFKKEKVDDIINIIPIRKNNKQEILKTMDLNQIKSIIGQSIVSSFLQTIEYDENCLVVKVSDATIEDKSYLSTGDKINKIIAIESYRWFCKIPQLTLLKLDVQSSSKGVYELVIARKAIEEHYGASDRFITREWNNIILNSLWTEEFIKNNDSKESRKRFSDKFVKHLA